MPPLWLDYLRPAPTQRFPGVLLLLAGLGLVGYLVNLSMTVSTGIDEAEHRLTRLKQQASREPAATPASEGAVPVPAPAPSRWEDLLAALESSADDSISLLSLTPTLREIVITGEARNLPAAFDYARRLQNAPVLGDAHLTKYEVMREHPQQPVRFTLLATWREGTP